MDGDAQQALLAFIVHGDCDERCGAQSTLIHAHASAVLLAEEERAVPARNERNGRRELHLRAACQRVDAELLRQHRRRCNDEQYEQTSAEPIRLGLFYFLYR
jgi:hypothetical protein